MFFVIAGVCLHYLQLRDLPSLILDCLVMESMLMDMWSMMTKPYQFGCKEELFQIHVMLGNLTHLYEHFKSTYIKILRRVLKNTFYVVQGCWWNLKWRNYK